ncbi:hypothetical protein EDC04DRAFT_2613659 [Pisolithus marmoratus]|nr:hypothetical protein EDC04DRAFT_2613659 [Pisolithus marmoratus]
MSQNIANTSLPTPTATQDWTAVLDEAIQSASKDDQETADAKYAEHQCQKRVKKEHKVADEAAAHERVAQAEVERWERECQEKEEHSYTVNSETKWSKMPVVDRLRVSAPVGNRPGTSVPVPVGGSKVKGKSKAHDPVPVGPCAQCVRAEVECTFELVKASKHGKKSCDWRSGLKKQCMLPGAEKKKKAGDKKKWVQAKSLEVQVQAGSSRSESVTGGILVAWGLQAIVAAIDWHTSEMVKHQEMAKETQCMQRQFNNHLYELLQETEYQQVTEVGELSDKGSTGKETSDETDEDTEGEEAPESDPEVGYHKAKTESW